MRVIVHVEGVVDVEEPCEDELECLLIYSQMLEKYENELGYCYGLSLQERVKCSHGYVEIKR
ncbi:conserved hypothetical protein [Betalipothrixvirus acidiani]|uniref:Viral structural protein n=1 Tax=Betalipothrixvirus acidiani TaxID=346881 RepID=A7WKA0_9VIRU|nr:virion structural protein [Acidianus filamentous virus 3]CAJ31501.1 conserved hypothetical protein [Acidianus filamentous virus 3]